MEIFKCDFEEERRDRTKAQGLLADFQSKKNIAAIYREQEALLRQERDSAIQERNDLKRELSKANVELSKRAEVATLKEGFKHHIKETEKIIRQKDHYKGFYEQVKPLEREVESSKKVIAVLRAHIEELNRKVKLKEKELHGAVEQVRECVVGIQIKMWIACVVIFPVNKVRNAFNFFSQKKNLYVAIDYTL